MECVKYTKGEFLPNKTIPHTQHMVSAESLLPKESRVAGSCIALFVQIKGKTYAARPADMVPCDAVLVRTGSGQVCGIPAVSGG